MTEVTVAATQMGCTKDCDQNILNAENLTFKNGINTILVKIRND